MPARGFIIAIENYAQSTSLGSPLQETNQAGENFRDWLMKKKGLKPADIFACAGPECPWRTTGPTRPEIIDELLKLAKAGQDKTAELYFFFSGHGFSYVESAFTAQTDVLVASN